MKRVVVIGAGPAGAAAAHTLTQRGVEVDVLEREAHLGGRARTHRGADGVVLDTGAGFCTSFYDCVSELVDDLGLQREILALERTSTLLRGGRMASISARDPLAMLLFPFLQMEDKLRMAAVTLLLSLLSKREGIDLHDPETLIPFDHETIARWATRWLGAPAYNTLIRPGIESFWYFSCEDASAGLVRALQGEAASATFYGFTRGMDRLVEELTRGSNVRTSTPVDAVCEGSDGVGVVVGGERLSADGVVIATTAPVASRLIEGLPEGRVTAAQRSYLAGVRYAPNVHVAFNVSRRELPSRLSTFFPCGEGVHEVAAITFNGPKRQGAVTGDHPREIVSVYLSATTSASLLTAPDDEIARRAWSCATAAMPALPGRCRPVGVWARREAIPVPAVGHFKASVEFARAQRPPVVFAGDYMRIATVEGAVRSGVAAAEVLIGRG